MTVSIKQLIAPTQIAATATTYYTATRVTARVDTFTLTNTDTAAQTVTVYLIASGGSASATNTIISAKSIQPGECYVATEMIGKTVPSGSFIQALCSTASKVTIEASGIEVT